MESRATSECWKAVARLGVPENTFEVTVRLLDCTDMRSTHCLKEFPLSHKTHEAVKARRHGCFIGLAVGDALGAAVEFHAPGTFEPVTEFRDGGPHGLNAGEWTDDTSMALALADSIINVGWDLNDQADRYLAWWRTGRYSVNDRCFDIGNATQEALWKFEQTADALRSGSRDERASGNGSIMRLAPVPIVYGHLFPGSIGELAQLASQSSHVTHASTQCLSACRYMAVLLAGLIHGLPRNDVLAPDWPVLQALTEVEPLHPAIDEIARGSFRKRKPPQIKGSGHVVRSLEAALWAFHDAADFREAVLRAVNLGDDADTTGAVCGQLAGACWGLAGIPMRWQREVARGDMLMAVAEQLSSASDNPE